MPNDVIQDCYIKQLIESTILKIENDQAVRKDIDKAYNDFTSVIITELDRKVPVKTVNCNTEKNGHKSRYKPYWTESLQEAWKTKVVAERKWMKENGSNKQKLRKEYCAIRKEFDRKLKREKRKYQRQQIDELECTFNSNKTEFWKEIGILGINNDRKQMIPSEIKKDAGVRDKTLVLEEWKTHFDDLYKSNEASN